MRKWVSASIIVLAFLGLMLTGCGGGGGGAKNVAVYKISGSVRSPAGLGMPGAAVILDGVGSATAFTNSSGSYTFSVTNGAYTVTPADSGYTCAPKASLQIVNGANIAEVNFIATASSPLLYVVDVMGNLGTVNIANGDVQVIGDTGIPDLDDIAIDPLDPNGNLYGVSFNTLYRIDKLTAVATPVHTLGISDATSLVFSSTGDRFYTADHFLYTVNSTTGATTQIIGNTVDPYQSSGDLAFIKCKLYLSSRKEIDKDVTTYLVRLDTLTGAGTQIGSIGFPNVFGMASNDNVNLYGFSGTKIIRIDVVTGAGTLIGDLAGHGLGNINGAAATDR